MCASVTLCNAYLLSLAPNRSLICANRWHKNALAGVLWRNFFLFIESCVFFSFNLFLWLLVFFAFHSTERNKKRDIRNWYQSANDRYNDAIEDKPRDTLRRGDIPILHGDCDGKWWPQSTLCVNAFIRSFIKLNFIGFSYLFARVKQAA